MAIYMYRGWVLQAGENVLFVCLQVGDGVFGGFSAALDLCN